MPIYPDKLYSNAAQVRATIKLRHKRRERGLDFSELAAALGLSVRDYVDKETGRTTFTAAERARLVAILGSDEDESTEAQP